VADEQDDSEKTEEPSQRKLEEARKKGDVAKSQELPTLLILFVAAILVMVIAPWTVREVARPLANLFASAHAIPTDAAHLRVVMMQIGTAMGLAVGLPLIVLMVAAAAGNLVQHQPVWSTEPLKPKFSKVSPLAGFKRLFSSESLVNFAKGLVKIAAVSAAIFLVLWPERDRIDLFVTMDVTAQLTAARDMTLKLLGAVIAVMLIVAALDFAYQRFRWMQKQRMSIKELREEFKQQEGSPEIKAKVKQIRRERAKRRMMAEVPNATVVVTNPTHFAVALKYAPGMPAPICVAKGVDAVALRIRGVAEDAGVPVVENPPLARTLHATVDIDEEVPPEHYKAVAQVIGYVMTLKNRRRWASG